MSGRRMTFVRSWATCNALKTKMSLEKAVYELMVLSQSSAAGTRFSREARRRSDGHFDAVDAKFKLRN